MMRRSFFLPYKVLIVESPNKIKKVGELATKLGNLGFSKEQKSLCTEAHERVEVVATVGHFQELGTIQYGMAPAEASVAKKGGKVKKEKGKKKSKKTEADEAAAESDAAGGEVRTFTPKWQLQKPFGNSPPKTQRLEALLNSKKGMLTEAIIATDPDREGELIASHVAQLLSKKVPGLPYSRAYIHAITEDGVKEALSERKINYINENLAQAAEARHMMDRDFGFLGSSIMRHVDTNLRSVGRVQTPSLILVKERDDLIKKYHEERVVEYQLRVDVNVTGTVDGEECETNFANALIELDRDEAITNEADAQALLAAMAVSGDSVEVTVSKPAKLSERSTAAPEPFTMPSLLSACSRQFNMTTEDTSKYLQDLFGRGLITYPRTDSTRLDPAFVETLHGYITETFGAEMLAGAETAGKKGKKGAAKKKSTKKSKKADENVEDAHEALRPTDVRRDITEEPGLHDNLRRVYNLILQTTLASQMRPKVSESVSVGLTLRGADGTEGTLRLTSSSVKEKGFTLAKEKVQTWSHVANADEDAAAEEGEKTDESVFKLLQQFTKKAANPPAIKINAGTVTEKKASPPAAFTEGSLIAELKKHGVGRPSTYPGIVKTLRTREYLSPVTRLTPQAKGDKVAKIAKAYFPDIVALGFTAKFEEQLDKIVVGDLTRDAVLLEFQEQFFDMISRMAQGEDASKPLKPFGLNGAKDFHELQNGLVRYLEENAAFLKGSGGLAK